MRVAAGILNREVLIVITTGQFCQVTAIAILKSFTYCIGIGLTGACFVGASYSPKALWLLPLAALTLFGGHQLGAAGERLRTKWEKEARDALPQAIDPEIPISTPPR